MKANMFISGLFLGIACGAGLSALAWPRIYDHYEAVNKVEPKPVVVHCPELFVTQWHYDLDGADHAFCVRER